MLLLKISNPIVGLKMLSIKCIFHDHAFKTRNVDEYIHGKSSFISTSKPCYTDTSKCRLYNTGGSTILVFLLGPQTMEDEANRTWKA